MNGRRIGVVMGAALGLSVIGGGIATADDTGVTVSIQGGPLLISVPGSASLGVATLDVDGSQIVGQLGTTSVQDNRGNTGGGWDVFAQSTDFVRDDGNASISAGSVGYAAGQVDTVGTVSIEAIDRDGIPNPINVVKALDVSGVNSASWNPTLTVPLPNATPPGNYSATITQSVS